MSATTGRADDEPADDGGSTAADPSSTGGKTDAEPTAAPPVLSVGLAVGLGGLAALSLAAGSLVAGAVGLLGVALLGASLSVVSTRLCSVAGAVLALAFVAAGATGAPAVPLLAGAILAVAAWDTADHALGLAAHVGREAVTRRNELVHAAASLAVGGAAGAVAFGGFLATGANQPVTALVFLLLGGVIILAVLRG